MRTKSTLISASLNQLNQKKTASDQPDVYKSSYSLSNSLITIENVVQFYNDNKNMTNLVEKYKAAQIREIELIKTLRRLNNEKLTKFLGIIWEFLYLNHQKWMLYEQS